MFTTLILGAMLSLATARDTMPKTASLELTVTNIRHSGGRVWVGIYLSEADFLDREKGRLVEAQVKKDGSLIIPISGLDYGTEYALAIFHDEDDDGELNTNWLGFPSEPWAFSGEPKTRLRLPRFEEVKFCFKQGKEMQTLRLRKW